MKVYGWIVVAMATVFAVCMAAAVANATVFWTADAEENNMVEWTSGGSCDGPLIFTQSAVKYAGTYAFKSDIQNPATEHQDGKCSKMVINGQSGIDDPFYYDGRYRIADGLDDNKFKIIQQWKEWKVGVPPCGVVMSVNIRDFGRGRELELWHQGCTEGTSPCIDFPDDLPGTAAGHYRALNVTVIPLNTWFELETFFKPTATYGQVKVILNETPIFNYSHQDLDLLHSECRDNLHVYFGSGLYPASTSTGPQVMYMDNVKVCDVNCP